MLPMAAGQLLLPLSAGLQDEALAVLRRLSGRVTVQLVGWTACATALMVWQGGRVMRLVYGQAFEQAGDMMRILGWAAAPLCLKPVLEKMLCGLQQQTIIWRWYVVLAIGHALVASLVIPRYGMTGAAISLLAVETFSVVVLAGALWRALSGSHAPSASVEVVPV